MAKQLYIDFDEYIRQGEPDKREKASVWSTAIGLQAVDGLTTSEYLQETARRNIEGEITIDEAQQLIHNYYITKTTHDEDDADKEEADRVSSNIAKILRHQTLAFSIVGITGIHEAIFKGVFKHAGKIRDYNISKKEFVLRGDSVAYMEYDWLRRALEYDLQQEKEFDYKGLSKEGIVKHVCRFIAGLWEIHPFCEGNTRTTAVFLIQYLRSMGFQVNNTPFAQHSWYFRNALVRANYSNPLKGVSRDYSFLEKFFGNLLLGETNELKNRYMVICPPDDLNIPDNQPDKLPDNQPDKLPCKLSDKFETNNENILRILKAIGEQELSVKEILKGMGLKDRENFMDNFLTPAMNEGFVRMLHPDSPHHPRQKYLLTVKGVGLYNKMG